MKEVVTMTIRMVLVVGLVALAATGCGRSRRAGETVECTPGGP